MKTKHKSSKGVKNNRSVAKEGVKLKTPLKTTKTSKISMTTKTSKHWKKKLIENYFREVLLKSGYKDVEEWHQNKKLFPSLPQLIYWCLSDPVVKEEPIYTPYQPLIEDISDVDLEEYI